MAGDPEIVPAGIPGRGDVIAGKYVVDRLLGVGGMGIVLAAFHRELQRSVAIKLLQPTIASNPVAVSRFVREAQAAGNLVGEHVARILDVGSLESGVPYMVMELLQGADLGALIAAGRPLPVAEAVGFVLQACEALAEAHQKGIIHRDLKPSNLFLTARPDGSPLIKVFDFGIAKLITEESAQSLRLTSTGSGMGSPQYMSPEQVRDASRVDARTDIWALGVTLYELLAAQPPFSGTTFSALCAQIIADAPIPLRDRRKDTPAGLEAVILRCLEKSPDRRFAGVAELAHALLPFAPKAGELSVARISSHAVTGALATTMPTPARARSPRGLALLGLLAGGAVLAGGIVVFTGTRAGESPNGSATLIQPLESASASAPPPAPTIAVAVPPSASAIASVAAPRSSSSSAPKAAAKNPAPPPPRGTNGHDPLDDRK